MALAECTDYVATDEPPELFVERGQRLRSEGLRVAYELLGWLRRADAFGRSVSLFCGQDGLDGAESDTRRAAWDASTGVDALYEIQGWVIGQAEAIFGGCPVADDDPPVPFAQLARSLGFSAEDIDRVGRPGK